MIKTSKISIVIMSAISALLAISLILNADVNEQTVGVMHTVNDVEVDETDISVGYSPWGNLDEVEHELLTTWIRIIEAGIPIYASPWVYGIPFAIDSDAPTYQNNEVNTTIAPWDFTESRVVYMDELIENSTEYGFTEETTSDYFDRPFFGITGLSINEHLLEAYNLPSIGVLVDTVMEDSGAENAGIKPSDIIVGFNNIKITTMEQLWDAIGDCNIGDKITIDLYRNELSMQVEVVLGSVP